VKQPNSQYSGIVASGAPPAPGLTRVTIAYLVFVVLPIGGAFWLLEAGSRLPASLNAASAVAPSAVPASHIVLRTPIFLTQIIVVIVSARLLGSALRRLGQPRVIGEMLAGLLLGPSFLGAVSPAAYAWLFPLGSVRFLNALSQIGIVLFMFLVGLELDLRQVVRQSRETLVLSHASIAVPLCAGVALAIPFQQQFGTADVLFPVFGLFLGCAMSVTAFPVLARILRDSGAARTSLGAMVMGCAAMADIAAWLILAFVISLARDNNMNVATLAHVLLGLAVYLVVMLALGRPLLKHICRRRLVDGGDSNGLTQNQLGGIVVVVLASAVATELLNVHAIFGAFVAGAIMPRDDHVNEAIRYRFEDVLSILLLPLFFAYAGLRTDIMAMTTTTDWLACGAIIAVAVVSKIGGSLFAGRAAGMSWHTAGAIGVLMNARGLMELVLLTIGLQLGIITPLLFTMMVIMALATTVLATPLFTWISAKSG